MITQSNLSKESLEIAKRAAHKVWEKYDDTYGYKTEKQTRNDNMSTDHPDNIWFFINQFDLHNQVELLLNILLEPESDDKIAVFNFVGDYLQEIGQEIGRMNEEIEKKRREGMN